jgi:hypothetical protein
MASRTKTKTTTKRGALKKLNVYLDGLSSQTAQLLRMRYGITADDEDVGEPSEECSSETRRLIEAIEKNVIDRARGKVAFRTTPKQKIIQALREKS